MLLTKEVIEQLKAMGLAKAQKKSTRNRIGVNEIVFTDKGASARYGCGAHHSEDPGIVELLTWDELEILFPVKPEQ